MFEYSSFISYRNDPHFLNGLADHLADLVAGEMANWVDPSPPFLDRRNGISPGSWVKGSIASAICKSRFMIVLFSPTYLSVKKTYCAAELHFMMEHVEPARLVALKEKNNKTMIIPIIVRGKEYIPNTLKKRAYIDLSDLTLLSDFKADRRLPEKLKQVGEAILALYQDQDEAEEQKLVDLCSPEAMLDPDSNDIIQFVKKMMQKDNNYLPQLPRS